MGLMATVFLNIRFRVKASELRTIHRSVFHLSKAIITITTTNEMIDAPQIDPVFLS